MVYIYNKLASNSILVAHCECGYLKQCWVQRDHIVVKKLDWHFANPGSTLSTMLYFPSCATVCCFLLEPRIRTKS